MHRYRALIGVLLLLVLPFVFYVSNSKTPRDHNTVDRVVVWISAPIQWLVTGTLEGVGRGWRRYVALMGVERENERLLRQNAELSLMLAARTEQQRENERLRRLLGAYESVQERREIYARVIAVSPSPVFRSLRVDRGSHHGVRLGAPVLNQDGVVGRVAAVASRFADVMLLVDANSSMDVLVGRSRARARVRGSGRDGKLDLEVQYLARTAAVEPGDVLVTSGAGEVFPKGLLVGSVSVVERPAFGLYQRAVAEAAVDFGRIEEVLILAGDDEAPRADVADADPLSQATP